jgi:glycosyltransferase involved in cell wall biosynthesis
MLWINDVTYAPLIRDTGWPSIYDVTDDWLVAPFSARELRRLAEMEQIALDDANEVVVCSESLRGTRGESRNVHLVPNAVDAEHFRRPLPRPRDLPVGGRVAVYVGSLHESRLDVDLVSETAMRLPSIDFALVGPNALAPGSCRRLARRPNIHLLGARPHTAVPAYLQHADVLIIPHRVTPFTESLDPIKVYECLAVGKPTVSTPVAGFRDCEPPVTIASRPHFAAAVEQALLSPETSGQAMALPTWEDRVDTIEEILAQIRTSRSGFGR